MMQLTELARFRFGVETLNFPAFFSREMRFISVSMFWKYLVSMSGYTKFLSQEEVHVVLEGPDSPGELALLLDLLADQAPGVAVDDDLVFLPQLLLEFELEVLVFILLPHLFGVLLLEGQLGELVLEQFSLHHLVEVEGIVERRNGPFKALILQLELHPRFRIQILKHRLTINRACVFRSISCLERVAVLAYFLIDFLQDILPGRWQFLLPLKIKILQVLLVLQTHGVGICRLTVPDLFFYGDLDFLEEGDHVIIEDLIDSFDLKTVVKCVETGAADCRFPSFQFSKLFLSEDAEGCKNAKLHNFADRPIIVNLLKVGVGKVLLVVDLSLVHEFPSVDVELVRVVNKQMALFFYFHFSLFQEVNVGGLLTLFVDRLIFLAFVD